MPGHSPLSADAAAEEKHEGYSLRISYDNYTLGAVGENFHAYFGAKGLMDYTYGGVHYLHNRIAGPNFFRAPTQNDTANMYGFRYGQWLQASLYQKIQSGTYALNHIRPILFILIIKRPILSDWSFSRIFLVTLNLQ